MNPREVELALRKQRLRIRADAQREDMLHRLAGIETALDSVDRAREYARWAATQAPLLSGGLLFLLLRPRRAWRLARRAWLAWLLLRKIRRSPLPAGLRDIIRRRATPGRP